MLFKIFIIGVYSCFVQYKIGLILFSYVVLSVKNPESDSFKDVMKLGLCLVFNNLTLKLHADF